MAQKQHTTYQADILSFELRDALLGILKPGRYIGYNAMSENTPPAGGIIVLDFDHDDIDKYDQTNPTPVLEATRGVAITTQGTVITEDQTITQNLTFINHASGGYHILYMNHAYLSGTPGANAATYGIKSGVGGGGLPTLDFPTRQVIIGVIKEDINGAVFSDLGYNRFYPGVGDQALHDKLFRSTGYKTHDEGSTPNDGIIGNRAFDNNNYIIDYRSITECLDDLDDALKTEETARIAVGDRPLDSALWAALSVNTNHDVNETRHGLMPVLSGEDDEFFRGDGTWQIPLAGFVFTGIASVSWHEDDTGSGGSITIGSTYEWDVSAIVPAGYTQIFINLQMRCFWGPDNTSGRYGSVSLSKGGVNTHGIKIDGPPPYEDLALYTGSSLFVTANALVELSATRTIRISWGNYSGSTVDWLDEFHIKVVAYR